MNTFKTLLVLTCLFSLFWQGTSAQTVNGSVTAPSNQIMIYYSDMGLQATDGHSWLIAAVHNSDGTSSGYQWQADAEGAGKPVYLMGTMVDGVSQIAISSESTYEGFGDPSTDFSNFAKVKSLANDETANISMFITQLAESTDSDSEYWMLVEGVGSIFIDDIDPSIRQKLHIPNGTLFQIQTVIDGDNHYLEIAW